MSNEANTCVEILQKAAQFGVMDCQCCPAYSVCPTGTAGWNNECMFDTAADLIESLAAELKVTNAIAALVRGLEVERDQLQARLEHVEYERDAAVKDLHLWGCFSCKHAGYSHSEICASCVYNRNRIAKGYVSGKNRYEWRGVKEESDD